MGEHGRSGSGTGSILQHLLARAGAGPTLRMATADGVDDDVHALVPALLGAIRRALGMDVAFVSQFHEGRRTFTHVDAAPGQAVIAAGASDPLEASWCQRVVDGRLPGFMPDAPAMVAAGRAPAAPFPIGTHLSVPVTLDGGQVYGTVCCFSFGTSADAREQDLNVLRSLASLIAAGASRPQAAVR